MVIVMLFLGNRIVAQTIAFTADTITSSGNSSEYEIVSNNYIENLTNADVTVQWKRISNNLSNGWTSSVCDKIACWNNTTDTKSFLLQANRTDNLDVHFYPNNNAGNGFVEMLVWVQGDSANTVVKATYKASANVASSVISASKKNYNVSFYPNPVKDYMMVSGLPENQSYKAELYSLLGTKVSTYNLLSGSAQGGVHQVDLQELPKGVYMLRIIDKNQNLVFNKSVSKMK
jgi:hypothetical protein